MPALLLAAVAYAGGTVIGATLGGPAWATALIAGLLAAVAALRRPEVEWRTTGFWLVLVAPVFFAAAGHARFETAANSPPPAIASLTGTHDVQGTVRRDATVRGTLARVDLDVTHVDGAPAPDGMWGGVRVVTRATGTSPALVEGDRVRLSGRVDPLERARDLDYASYLASRGIHATVAYPAEFAVEGNTGGWRPALASVRRGLVASIERTLPEPGAALAAGVLVGKQGALPDRTAEALRVTGTTHLVVVSGHNDHLATI